MYFRQRGHACLCSFVGLIQRRYMPQQKASLAVVFSRRYLSIVTLVLLCLSSNPGICENGARVGSPPAAASDTGIAAHARTIVVFGDSQAQGLAWALNRLRGRDGRYKIVNQTKPGTGLWQTSSYNWPAVVRQFGKAEPGAVAVMMFGSNDWMPIRDSSGRWLRFGSEAWEQYYRQRVITVSHFAISEGFRVVWVGDPLARSPSYNHAMKLLNEVYQIAAMQTGSVYLDTWSVVSDEAGNFTVYGESLDGSTERLRADDGIHFTFAGYQIIARHVVRQLENLGLDAVVQPLIISGH